MEMKQKHSVYVLHKRLELGNLKEGKVDESHGIGLDNYGNILITDPTIHRVFRYSQNGEFIDEIGFGPGTGFGEFDGPRDVKVDKNGNVFVIDGNSGKLKKVCNDGKIIESDSEIYSMDRPHSLDFDSLGNIYIAVVDDGKIAVFDQCCNFVRDWDVPVIGEEKNSAVHGIGLDQNDNIIAVDYNGYFYKFTNNGKLIFKIETQSLYHAMCTDCLGNIYFAARDQSQEHSFIEKFDNSGKYIQTINIQHSGTVHPVCLVVDSQGTIFAADDKGIDILVPKYST